jgi:hypothetical protein
MPHRSCAWADLAACRARYYADAVGHDASLGFLGDSAFLILVVFFAIGGLIVFRMLGEQPHPNEEPTEPEKPETTPLS